ncbi:TPA: hypothetical protein DEG21_04050 [Patescibacteria group bacterium]|nr:hypothetical protein [Candidatus Gracilibacteria bacterium]
MCSEKIQEKIPETYFSSLSTSHFAQSIVSSTEYKSFIIGISLFSILSSSNVIHLREYVIISAFSRIELSDGVIFQSIKFKSHIRLTIAHLSKSPGLAS